MVRIIGSVVAAAVGEGIDFGFDFFVDPISTLAIFFGGAVAAAVGEGIDVGFDFCVDPISTLAIFFGGVSIKSSILMYRQVMAKGTGLEVTRLIERRGRWSSHV